MFNLGLKTGASIFFLIFLGWLGINPVIAQELSNDQIYSAAVKANCIVRDDIGLQNTNASNWRGKIICHQSSKQGYKPIQKWMIDAAVTIGGRKVVINAFSELRVL
jgi:hypothetical protein